MTPALLAADLCPDQTRVSYDPQQVSANWNQNILEESLFSQTCICQSDRTGFRKNICSFESGNHPLPSAEAVRSNKIRQLTSGSVLSFANVLFVNDIKEGRPARAGVILGLRGELVHTADHTLVHSPLPVLVVHVAVLSEKVASRHQYIHSSCLALRIILC